MQAQDCYFSDGGCAVRRYAVEGSRMLTSWRCFFGRLFRARGEQYGENLRTEGGAYRLSAEELEPHRHTESRLLHERAG